MKHIEIRRSTQKKLATLGVLSLAALSQFGIAPQTAQAAPPDYAPAYGYRNQANAQRVTLRGTVTRDSAYNNRFAFRDDNGRTYEVYLSQRESLRLSVGDYVEVTGRLDGNNIRANSARLLYNQPGNNNGIQVITGRVARDFSGREFQLRSDNGRTYLVRTRNAEPLRLSAGDRVEVRGSQDRGIFLATSVRITRNNNGDNGNDNNDDNNQVLTGRVSRDYSGRDFEMRTDNGRSVTVRSRGGEPIRLTSGDRVQVRGDMSNGIFRADSVRIVNNDDTNSNGSRVNFTGTVQRGGSGQFTVRADNGRDYTVQNSNVSVGYGDRVSVVGYLSRGVVRAERVDVRDRMNDGNTTNNGRNVRFEGRVRQVGSGYLIVRNSDSSQDRTVRVSNAADFTRGDRVTVVGRRSGNEIIASSVVRR